MPRKASPESKLDESTVVTSASGVRLPRILYGTAWKKAQTEPLVRKAIEIGFRGIDTACQPLHYEEAGVGAGVAASLGPQLTREQLYLQTKFTPLRGHDPKRIPYDPNAPLAEQVEQSFEASLANLRTTWLDCLILHSPLETPERTLEAWQALETLVDRGRVRQLGISNCYDLPYFQAFYEAVRIKPAVLQNRFYAESNYDMRLRSYCKQQNVIYQSFWTLTANKHLLESRAVRDIAAKYKRTPEQVLFRYLIQEQCVPLTGTKSEQHMREDLAIFEFRLNRADCAQILVLL